MSDKIDESQEDLDTATKALEHGPQDDSPQQDKIFFPEGGIKAWSTVLGAFLVQFCGFGYGTSFGVFQDYYVRVHLKQVSASTISWIGSVNVFIIVGGGLIAGRVYDRGYFYHLLYGGAILSSFSLFMLSLAKEGQYYQVFLSQGLGQGIGAGMLYVPSIAITSHYFQQRRNLIMAIVAAGSSFGAIVHPIMLNNTLDKIGFANATRASAGLVSGSLLVACLLMRPRLLPPKNVPTLKYSLIKFSKDKAYLACGCGLFFFNVGMFFPLFYLQLDSNVHGLDQTFSFYSLVILNASAFIGRMTAGFLIIPFGVESVTITTTACCSVLIFAMTAISTVPSVIVLALIYGYLMGAYIALMAPMVTNLADNFSEMGMRIGISFAVAGIGGLIGSPIDGALLGSSYHWWKATVFSGIMACIGSFSYCVMVYSIYRRKRQQIEQIERGSKDATTAGPEGHNSDKRTAAGASDTNQFPCLL